MKLLPLTIKMHQVITSSTLQELEEQQQLLKLAADFADKSDALRFNAVVLEQLARKLLENRRPAHQPAPSPQTQPAAPTWAPDPGALSLELSTGDSAALKRLLRSIRLRKIPADRLNVRGRTVRTVICRLRASVRTRCDELQRA